MYYCSREVSLKENVYIFSIDYNAINKCLFGLLSFSGFLATKCKSLNNVQFKTRPFIIDKNPVELKYYPYTITLDNFNGSCNTFTKIFDRICVLNRTENVNLNVFNLVTKINESKM